MRITGELAEVIFSMGVAVLLVCVGVSCLWRTINKDWKV
jgi:hypothetical protein